MIQIRVNLIPALLVLFRFERNGEPRAIKACLPQPIPHIMV